jgi:hypothetical protein
MQLITAGNTILTAETGLGMLHCNTYVGRYIHSSAYGDSIVPRRTLAQWRKASLVVPDTGVTGSRSNESTLETTQLMTRILQRIPTNIDFNLVVNDLFCFATKVIPSDIRFLSKPNPSFF